MIIMWLKGIHQLCEQCIPGSLSYPCTHRAWVRGRAHLVHLQVVMFPCPVSRCHVIDYMTTMHACRLYDRQLEVVQVSRGHTDSIQSIAHVPELNLVRGRICSVKGRLTYILCCVFQYFSAGWDNTMRIWKAYHPRHSSTDNLSPLKQ